MVSQVCREWEAAALRVNKDVRLARIRIGVVLGKEGGALGTCHHILFHFSNSKCQLDGYSYENFNLAWLKVLIFFVQTKSSSGTYWLFFNLTAKMIPIFMMFAGGPLGSGRQW